eukprot:5159842-Pyramimonas_sp.AAC.1
MGVPTYDAKPSPPTHCSDHTRLRQNLATSLRTSAPWAMTNQQQYTYMCTFIMSSTDCRRLCT